VIFVILPATMPGEQMEAVRSKPVRSPKPLRLTVCNTDGTEQSLTVIDAPATEISPQETLAHRFASGDAAAFDEVVAEFAPRIGRLAHRLLGWNWDIDDVVQEVFVAALKRQRHFRRDASLWTWLSAIAVNQCRSRLRRRKSWRRWIGFQRERHESPSPSDTIRDETSQRVRDAVGQLKQDDREVIVLFYLEDQSIRQIAEMLGKTGNAVEVRLHRARQRLAAMLKDFADE
jgi:RNA polymerase sigma-70 factor (ECF subfamily)